MCEKLKNFYGKEWTMEEKVLLTAVCVLGGALFGMLMAPFKKIICGNNNGNSYGPEFLEELDEFEEE